MKRLVVTTILGLATSLSCFAQGNFVFNNTTATAVWDNRTGSGFKAGATMEVAILWSADTSAVPTTYLGGLASPTNGSFTASWAGVFSDPNFQLAHETTGGNPVIVSTAGGLGPQAGIYLGGLHYINGSTAFETVKFYVIGWDKSYGLDPVAASLAGAPMGVSAPIVFTLGNAASPGGSLANAGISPLGVNPVPEPTTFALAGLGAAALLIFRRRRN